MSNPYLIEPYNAYTHGKKRKKHWTELMEEEALYHKMIQDQLRLQETKEQTSQQQTTAMAAAAAGAGGVAPYEFYHPEGKVVDFLGTPTSGDAPLAVVFTNKTNNVEGDTYLWIFGDGQTSGEVAPTHTYAYTGSLATTGSYTVILQMTQSSLGQMTQSIKTNYISASLPQVSILFVPSRVRTNEGDTITYTTTISGANTFTWSFGAAQGSATASLTNPTSLTFKYWDQAAYTASVTASNTYYGTSTFATASILVDAVVTAAFTTTNNIGNAPLNVTFSNTSTDATTYKWLLGSGSLTATTTNYSMSYSAPGLYTVTLQATGTFGSSSAKVSSSVVYAKSPQVTASFTTEGERGTAPLEVTFSNTSTGANTYLWLLGTSSFTSAQVSPSQSYENVGSYTVTLQATSSFGSASALTSASMVVGT